MELLKNIEGEVHARRDLMLQNLERLVNIDSPTREKSAADLAADQLEEWSRAMDLEVERDRQSEFGDNVIARWRPEGSTGQPRILLVGHYDTVFSSGTAAARPFRVDGEKAYGPGVFDMKGGIIIGLVAFDAVRAAARDWRIPLTFIFNSDEEDGSWGSREAIRREAEEKDLVLILEPSDAPGTGPQVLVGRKGGGSFRLIVKGRESHAGAAPDQGRNSIVEMAHKIRGLEELADGDRGTTICPGVITGGRKSYVVPELCELDFDVRVASQQELDRVSRGLQALLGTPHVPGTRTEVQGQFHRPPWVPSERSLEYAGLLQQVSEAFDYPQAQAISGSASDGNNTAAIGVPTLDGFGPTGGRHHSPDEYVDVPSFALKASVLAGFLAALGIPELRASLGATADNRRTGSKR
jgi:glutamate carboxypeptidase